MAVINLRHIQRRTGADDERDVVAGDILMPPGRTSYDIGSFKLRRIESIFFSTRTPKSGAWGSIGSAYNNKGFGNNFVMAPIYTGTTGTRLASIATIGSVRATGSALVSFIAIGQ